MRDYDFLPNFSGREQAIALDRRGYADSVSGDTVGETFKLAVHRVKVLTRCAWSRENEVRAGAGAGAGVGVGIRVGVRVGVGAGVGAGAGVRVE